MTGSITSTLMFLILIVLIAGGILYFKDATDLKGYEARVRLGNAPCAALSPDCGYCPRDGLTEGGWCYYNKYPGLDK